MRMPADTFDTLRATIATVDTDVTREAYRTGRIPRAEAVKDLDKRYRWDLYWATRAWQIAGMEDLADTHIDTALRRIVRPLGEE